MSTNIRPEISKNSIYHISKHRYLELSHFCRQYHDFIRIRKELECEFFPNGFDREISSKVFAPSDPTAKAAAKLYKYDTYIELIEDCIRLMDDYIQEYLFKAVTEGKSYEWLYANMQIPCSRGTFYDRYRKFFYMLHVRKV